MDPTDTEAGSLRSELSKGARLRMINEWIIQKRVSFVWDDGDHALMKDWSPDIVVNGAPIPHVDNIVTVRVGRCFFSCSRTEYPSTRLIAQVALALHSGLDKAGIAED